ncbi:MAG: hypothetical protein PQJ50_03135, partial [Spirochaetales bacterium]|nr:hypothetical protein [Spirochaetales bacterium]
MVDLAIMPFDKVIGQGNPTIHYDKLAGVYSGGVYQTEELLLVRVVQLPCDYLSAFIDGIFECTVDPFPCNVQIFHRFL